MSLQKETTIDVFNIIEKNYKKDSDLYNILVNHSRDVAQKAISIVKAHPELDVDPVFIEEAAMLHDIGISMTNAPYIHCYGIMPYLCHGYLGREILENEGLPKHALVCERHTGVGMTAEDIKALSLPLPCRDMLPVTTEEQIICFADCFFSKNNIGNEKTIEEIKKDLSTYTTDKGIERFDQWCEKFL